MTIRATDTDKRYYTHMFSLSDGVTTLGFNAVDNKGQPNIRAVRQVPYPKSTIQVNTGSGDYSQRRLPYCEWSRDDWSGGMGVLDADDDATRYWFGSGVWTPARGKIMQAPMVRDALISTPAGTTEFLQQIGVHVPEMGSKGAEVLLMLASYQAPPIYRIHATKFTTVAAATITAVRIPHLYALGSPGDLLVKIFTDNSGEPSTTQVGGTGSYDGQSLCGNDVVIKLATAASLSATTDYWIVFESDADDDISNCYYLPYIYVTGLPSGYSGAYYTGSVWSSGIGSILFDLIEDTEIEYAQMFRYKWGLYAIVRERGTSTGRLFLNGDRGAADSNSGALTTLVDGSKSSEWVDDQWTGCIVRIYNGPGVGEYRKITDSTTTTLTVDRAWDTTHTTSTEYVILGAKTWREIVPTIITSGESGIDKVEDVCVSNEGVVYFACGDTNPIVRYREYNASGTWTRQVEDDYATGTYPGASRLLFTYDQEYGASVWRAVNAGSGSISRASAAAWGTDLSWGTEIKIGGLEQDITDILEYEGKIAVIKMDSIWMIFNGVPDKLSMDYAYMWERENGENSSVWTPYLVTALGSQTHRIYNNVAESFGPEKEDALPRMFNGVTAYTMSIVGGGLIGIDGNHIGGTFFSDTGNSGVYLYRGGGWHPIAHFGKGSGLRCIFWDAHDDRQDILWVWTRTGPRWMPICRYWDYQQDRDWVIPEMNVMNEIASSYGGNLYYTLDGKTNLGGYFLTGVINGGSDTLLKYWDTITLYSDNGSLGSGVKVYYRTTDIDTSSLDFEDPASSTLWTAITPGTNASKHELTIGVESINIQFLIKLGSTAYVNTRVINGINLQYLMRVESANQYIIPTRSTDFAFDREGNWEGSGTDAETIINKLQEWKGRTTPLTMRSIWESYDNKSVMLEGVGTNPLWLDKDTMSPEAFLIDLTLLEV